MLDSSQQFKQARSQPEQAANTDLSNHGKTQINKCLECMFKLKW